MRIELVGAVVVTRIPRITTGALLVRGLSVNVKVKFSSRSRSRSRSRSHRYELVHT